MSKCLWLSVLAVAAWAADGADAPPTPPSPQPIKIGGITVSGNFRARLEDWSFFHGDGANGGYAYSGNLFRLAFSQSSETFDWQLEFSVPFLIGLPITPSPPARRDNLDSAPPTTSPTTSPNTP